MSVTLRQLRAFLAVAETRHFRLAAERLHLTQPAMSRHVAELEAQLGVRLFDRSTRDVSATEIGRRLHARLSRVLDELDTLLTQTRFEGEGLNGTVRVAAGATPSAELMPQCIARCASYYPDLALIARDRMQSEVLAAVLAGEVDFGVVIDPPPSREVVTETILQDPFVLVCHRDHVWAQKPRVAWQELADQPLVLLDHNSGSRRLIDAILAEQNLNVRVVQETGHTHTAFRMVEAGLGSSITVGLSSPRGPELITRPLVPLVQRSVMLIRRRTRALTPPAQRVWQQLREVAAEHGNPGRDPI